MGDLVIDFQNYSLGTLNSDYNVKNLESHGTTVKTWPSGTLTAGSGNQECLITQNLAKLDVGSCNFAYCWNNGVWRFGVKIIAYDQGFGIGDRPSWQIAYDQNVSGGEPDWIDNGESAGDSYTWPTTVGLSILATPTSTHQGLSVSVKINDLPSTKGDT